MRMCFLAFALIGWRSDDGDDDDDGDNNNDVGDDDDADTLSPFLLLIVKPHLRRSAVSLETTQEGDKCCTGASLVVAPAHLPVSMLITDTWDSCSKRENWQKSALILDGAHCEKLIDCVVSSSVVRRSHHGWDESVMTSSQVSRSIDTEVAGGVLEGCHW